MSVSAADRLVKILEMKSQPGEPPRTVEDDLALLKLLREQLLELTTLRDIVATKTARIEVLGEMIAKVGVENKFLRDENDRLWDELRNLRRGKMKKERKP